MKLLIINGPNMNLLGIREPELYGKKTYQDLVDYIQKNRGDGNDLIFIQSNHEGDIIDAIAEAYETKVEGIVINAAAYSHTSIAIMDALKAVAIPTVEVHLTDTASREEYRHHSYIGEVALETFAGYGFEGYIKAIDYLIAQ